MTLNSTLCFHPLAQQRLVWGRPQELLLILDPTTQEDRLVMVSAAVWYRGRALPLGWVIWPGNTPLKGERFWTRIAALLDMIAPLLPCGVSVTWLADRAFGTPAFTDLLTARGWHYLVRVQEHTLFRDRLGREWQAKQLAAWPGQRAKRRGHVFKKRGWRPASMLVYWGRRHPERLCLVTDLRPGWYLIALYRRRYPIEIVFTQMTKTNMSAGFGGRDDVADFHLGVIDNHPVNQQFYQFSFLVKCSLGQPLLDPLTESFNRRGDGVNLNLFMELGF
jgi:hypothetical protein